MKTIYTTNLTGTKMSQLGKVLADISIGTRLSIHRRPDNAYDSQAMSVHLGDHVTDPQVGWIPAKELEDKIVKSVLFSLMSHGIDLHAEVVQFEPESRFLRVNIDLWDDHDFTGLMDDDGLEAEPDEDEDE